MTSSLKEILRHEVKKYAGRGVGVNVRRFAILDDIDGIYAVNTVPYPERTCPANVVILASIENETIIIEEDRTDKPLFEALLAAGVPREKKRFGISR